MLRIKMEDTSGQADHEKYQSYLRVHLKKSQLDLPTADQVSALEKRARTKWWHLAINIAALLFFGYSFYYDITQLSQTFFVIIIVVFGINVGLILFQQKQIRELIQYLKTSK